MFVVVVRAPGKPTPPIRPPPSPPTAQQQIIQSLLAQPCHISCFHLCLCAPCVRIQQGRKVPFACGRGLPRAPRSLPSLSLSATHSLFSACYAKEKNATAELNTGAADISRFNALELKPVFRSSCSSLLLSLPYWVIEKCLFACVCECVCVSLC